MKLDFRGMTVNERLYHTSQLDVFDEAVSRRDEVEVERILRSIQVPQISIDLILDNVRKFGVGHDPNYKLAD